MSTEEKALFIPESTIWEYRTNHYKQNKQGKVRLYCPIHGGDGQLSFVYFPETGRFKCHNCHVWGYTEESQQKQKGFPRRKEKPLRKVIQPTEYHDRTAIAREYQDYFTATSVAAKYLLSRGITFEVAQRLGIGYSPMNTWAFKRKDGTDAWGWPYGRVTFPHTLPNGDIVNIYGRAIGESKKITDKSKQQYFQKAKHSHLTGAKGYFNAEAFLAETVYICEGAFDALSLIAAGYNACAIFGTHGMRWELVKSKTLVLCLDNDQAGSDAWRELAQAAVIRGKNVYFLEASAYQGCKDLNEVWQRTGTLNLGELPDAKNQVAVTTVIEEPSTTILPSNDVVTTPTIPDGYSALGCNELEKLNWIKERIIQTGLVAFDYESNSDPDDDTQDPQDTQVVGVSLSWEIGKAVYLPISHETYAYNWDRDWLFENFLTPVLMHPDVTILAHNIKVEHQWSILNGLNLYKKAMDRKAMDTMLMVKALALPENTDQLGKVRIGLKPATKALLANEQGMVHNLLHVDDIKSFKETVGIVEWQEPDPSGALYKSGVRKGTPKMIKKKRTRRFDELSVDQHTIDYACSDSDWSLGLYRKLLPQCQQEGLLDVLQAIDIPRMMVLGEYELAGWHVNQKGFQEMREEAETHLPDLEKKLMHELKQLAGQENADSITVPAGSYFMGDDKGNETYLVIKVDRPFSWSSTAHKQWLFFHILGLDTKDLKRSDKTGLPSVDKENMKKIEAILHDTNTESPVVSLLKEKMHYDKILSTYVEGMGQFVREDTNKLHTNFGLVDTWRYNSKKPNLQNIPKPDNDPFGIRNLFVAPTYDPNGDYSQLNEWTRPASLILEEKLSGETLWIGADYSQLELRVVAAMANEKGMLEAFHAGYDLHSATARDVFNLPCSVPEVKDKYKSYRKKAKAINFGLVYGISKYGLSGQLGISIDEAQELMDDYFKAYPNIKKFMDGQVSFARQNGYVNTLFNHRRPILRPLKGYEIRKAMNTPVQGGGADIITRAMVAFRDIHEDINQLERYQIPINDLGLFDLSYTKKLIQAIKPVMQIHDELIFEVPVEYAANAAKYVKAVMEAPIKGFTDLVPLVADPAVGKSWAHNLDIDWDTDGTPYVVAKTKKDEPADVTIDEIDYALPLYKKAGIDVRVN